MFVCFWGGGEGGDCLVVVRRVRVRVNVDILKRSLDRVKDEGCWVFDLGNFMHCHHGHFAVLYDEESLGQISFFSGIIISILI